MRAANMTARVANEVELHWQLHHPAILELYNYFEDSNYVYLVMEFCQNGELFKYMQRRHGRITEPEVRRIMITVVKGLQYLHHNGIIHRDLKLSNILITNDYECVIQISD
jgi:polo-like kinase 4